MAAGTRPAGGRRLGSVPQVSEQSRESGSPLPAADWYVDPEDESQFRFWDGSAWAEHRSPRYASGEEATGSRTTEPAGGTVVVGLQPEPIEAGRGLRPPGRLLGDTMGALRRHARVVTLVALVQTAGYVTAGVLAAGAVLAMASAANARGDSDLAATPMAVVAGLAAAAVLWATSAATRAVVPYAVTEGLAGRRAVSAWEPLWAGFSRTVRMVWLDVRMLAVALAVAVVVVVPSTAVPESVAPVVAVMVVVAWLAFALWGSVLAQMAYVAASVTDRHPPLRRTFKAIRGCFWGLLGRLLLVWLVVGVAAGVAGGVWAVVMMLVAQVAAEWLAIVLGGIGVAAVHATAAAFAAAAAAICWHDLPSR